MTDVPSEATTCDQAAAFFRALSGSVRVAVYKPNAGREWDVSTFDPAAIKADISAKDAEIAQLRDDLAQAESDRAELVLAINSAVYLLYVPGDLSGIKARAHAARGVALQPKAGGVKECPTLSR